MVQPDLNRLGQARNETDGEPGKMKGDETQLGHREGRKRRDIQERRRREKKKKEKKGKQRTGTPAQAVYFHDFSSLVNI